MKLLYVSVDGVLQPLGYSQVCRLIYELTKRGYSYELLSLEKPSDLADERRVKRLEDELRAHGVQWTHHPYRQEGTVVSATANLLQLGMSIRRLTAGGQFQAVHARAYHAAFLAMGNTAAGGPPYIFDARGRWVDERIAGGRWFREPKVAAMARAIERQLYQRAQAIVVLTQIHADDILRGDLGVYRGAPVRVITTCADFQQFRLAVAGARPAPGVVPAAIRARLEGKFVLSFIGSINASYRYEESFALAARVMRRRRDSHLLILTAQPREFAALAANQGLGVDQFSIATADHRDMPEWLTQIDWCIHLLHDGAAKRGSMPTKLAEFFAAGVRPAHYGCNAEVGDWITRAGSGYLLSGLDDESLSSAAEYIASSTCSAERLQHARDVAHQHFSLEHGVEMYISLFEGLRRGSLG